MTSIISSIKDDLMSQNMKLNIVLFKCYVLFYKLKNDEICLWIEKEINGYDLKDEIPIYRNVYSELKGEFKNDECNEVVRLPVDPIMLTDYPDILEMYYPARIYASVESIEHMIGTDEFYEELSGEVALAYQKYYKKSECCRVVMYTPDGSLKTVITKIRFKVLMLILEIEEKIPDIESIIFNNNVTKKEVSAVEKIVNNTNVYGSNNNIANSSSDFTQSVQMQTNEIINELLEKLISVKNNENESEVNEIKHKIEELKNIKDESSFLKGVLSISSFASNVVTLWPVVQPYISRLSSVL